MRIDIVVYDGVDEMDALGPLEVFRRAERLGAEFRTELVTREPQQHVTGSYGLRFLPDATYSPGADLLIVPGGGWAARTEAGAWGEVERGDWLPLLTDAATRAVTAGVCTGSMLLAHAGVIGARRANTHHAAQDDLRATGATVVTDRVVDDGDVLTAGGVSSGVDLALWIVERFADREFADRIATHMEYDRVRPADTSGAGS
ncbi:DJ-1/PfpI family protein [Allosaccharopolyspora coralli]|uniref:DJ-1/PfpI family protein n=1 Tax=Allosaccharopolyspora coralli TaxID=2665642 RepID=A0A5Q3Q2R1_9PSEU|nr:DJ-1/PfpI family protein [Allosaccharopolyspora coralli]QGK68643.1 DJ-1/PfpI family protein [Allosaccharopolyspora coralli]